MTPRQREALDAYEHLVACHPECFSNRELRPIVREIDALEAYAAENGVVLGVVATTPDVYFVADLVESLTARGEKILHPYIRLVLRKQLEGAVSTVVLATIANPSLGRVGDIVFVEQERHATGAVETELPRGFGELGLAAEQNAVRELRQETGAIGEEAHLLGSTYTDSGIMDGRVSFYHVPVTAWGPGTPETEEALAGLRLVSREEAWEDVMAGRIRDGLSLQAMALFERHRSDGRPTGRLP